MPATRRYIVAVVVMLTAHLCLHCATAGFIKTLFGCRHAILTVLRTAKLDSSKPIRLPPTTMRNALWITLHVAPPHLLLCRVGHH